MKLSNKQKSIFSILFLIGYSFFVFVAQHIHHHEANFCDQNVDKTIVKKAQEDASDCLACHFLYEAKHLSGSASYHYFDVVGEHSKVESLFTLNFCKNTFTTLSLRGPPSRVI